MTKKKTFKLQSNASLLDEITGSVPIPELAEQTAVESRPIGAPVKAKSDKRKAAKKKITPKETSLPMPPTKESEVREYFTSRQRPELIQRVQKARKHLNSKVQDIVELALEEFLSRRGL